MRGGRGEIPNKDNSLYEAQRPVREGLRGFLESWSTPSSLCTSPHALLRRLEREAAALPLPPDLPIPGSIPWTPHCRGPFHDSVGRSWGTFATKLPLRTI